jgi:hypothetical protein
MNAVKPSKCNSTQSAHYMERKSQGACVGQSEGGGGGRALKVERKACPVVFDGSAIAGLPSALQDPLLNILEGAFHALRETKHLLLD